MTPKRKQRLLWVVYLLAGLGITTALALQAFKKNMMYFHTPTDVKQGKVPINHDFRIGGMVVKGSVKRQPGSLSVSFDLTDNHAVVSVFYTGILPDLFREGQGIIAKGRLTSQGQIQATQVLAKHDENYMPPEVGEALNKYKGHGQ